MILFLAAASASLTAPKPVKALFTVVDYPDSALRRAEEGSVIWQVLVSPKGRPVRCKNLAASGAEIFGKISCGVVMNRGRFIAARDAQGQPIYGLYTTITNFWVPRRGLVLPTMQPDITLNVQKLPSELGNQADVQIDVLVDQEGSVSACAPQADEAQPKLAKVACAQLSSLWTASPQVDEKGGPIAYVKAVKVRFEAGQ